MQAATIGVDQPKTGFAFSCRYKRNSVVHWRPGGNAYDRCRVRHKLPTGFHLLTTTAELAGLFQDWCRKATDIRVVTAWATSECLGCKDLTTARDAISTLVVGLDFHQTAPSFLEAFRSNVRIGVAAGSATFHPKVYLFQSGKTYCCIVGSSNFTGGGFGSNVELNVSITGGVTDAFFSEAAAFIKSQEDQSETFLQCSDPQKQGVAEMLQKRTFVQTDWYGQALRTNLPYTARQVRKY